MRPHREIDASTRAGYLVNGRWLQLRVLPAFARRHGAVVELLRKHDQQRLMRWLQTTSRIRAPRGHLARRERSELGDLLQQLRPLTRAPASATRLAQTEIDAGAALRHLGLPADIVTRQRLPLHPEPQLLVACGKDMAGRNLYLEPSTARAWQRMRAAAADDGIRLLPVSGFRSLDYQTALVARKLVRGMAVDDILRYSALPGRSEHHLGTVLDLHDGDGEALEETFEDSAAFDWLSRHAARFGFHLSYPRDNRWQIGYEPWHWRYLSPTATERASTA